MRWGWAPTKNKETFKRRMNKEKSCWESLSSKSSTMISWSDWLQTKTRKAKFRKGSMLKVMIGNVRSKKGRGLSGQRCIRICNKRSITWSNSFSMKKMEQITRNTIDSKISSVITASKGQLLVWTAREKWREEIAWVDLERWMSS